MANLRKDVDFLTNQETATQSWLTRVLPRSNSDWLKTLMAYFEWDGFGFGFAIVKGHRACLIFAISYLLVLHTIRTVYLGHSLA